MTRLAEIEDWARSASPSLERMLRFFGARQIKNSGTLGGNICTASPIGDLPPALISLGAEALILNAEGERRCPLEDFFVAYRETALAPGEILGGVWLPTRDEERWVSRSYKVSKRQELDISTVSSGISLHLSESGDVLEARIAYGGMAATPARASGAEAALIGAPLTETRVHAAMEALRGDFQPIDDHRGSAWYRSRRS